MNKHQTQGVLPSPCHSTTYTPPIPQPLRTRVQWLPTNPFLMPVALSSNVCIVCLVSVLRVCPCITECMCCVVAQATLANKRHVKVPFLHAMESTCTICFPCQAALRAGIFYLAPCLLARPCRLCFLCVSEPARLLCCSGATHGIVFYFFSASFGVCHALPETLLQSVQQIGYRRTPYSVTTSILCGTSLLHAAGFYYTA